MASKIYMYSKLWAVSGVITLVLSGVAIADNKTDDKVLERIRPLGHVNVDQPIAPVEVAGMATAEPVAPAAATETPAPAVPAAPVVADGKKIYEGVCFACHAVGAAGSPKFADKEAWAPRIAKGEEALLNSTFNGTAKGMPPRGACGTCSDEDIKAAVEYMVSQSK